MSQFFSFFAAGLCHSNQVVTWKKEAPRLFFPKLQDSFSSSRICSFTFVFCEVGLWIFEEQLYFRSRCIFPLTSGSALFQSSRICTISHLRSLSHKLYACWTGWSEKEKVKGREEKIIFQPKIIFDHIDWTLSLSLSLSLYIYIYIYIWSRWKPHPKIIKFQNLQLKEYCPSTVLVFPSTWSSMLT